MSFSIVFFILPQIKEMLPMICLPLFIVCFGVYLYVKLYDSIPDFSFKRRPQIKQKTITHSSKINNTYDDVCQFHNKIDEAKALMNLIDPSKVNDRHKWFSIGLSLYKINPSLLDCWIDFSQKTRHFTKKDCIDIWQNTLENIEYKDSIQSCGNGIHNLHNYALNDNPEAYKKLSEPLPCPDGQ